MINENQQAEEDEEHWINEAAENAGINGASAAAGGNNVISSSNSSSDSSGALESSDDHLADILSLSGPFRSNKWRAKLYQLNSNGSWDDFGTGEFQIVRDVSKFNPLIIFNRTRT